MGRSPAAGAKAGAAVDAHGRQFKGLGDCLAKIYKADGVLGLYRGFGVSLAGIIVYRAGYFGLYDSARSMTGPNSGVVEAFAVAQVTTALAGLVAYPFDTVRRRLMMQAGKAIEAREYNGTLDCWRKIAAQEGTKGFFKGAFTNVVRGAGAAVVLPLYDEVQKMIK